MTDVSTLRQTLEQKKGQKAQIQKSIKETKQQIKVLKQQLIQHEKAREIIREVGLITQKQLQVHISDIVSLALEAVFPNPYVFEVNFTARRNRTECDLFFVRNNKKIDPITASGGGAVDIASFALRVASWSMAMPHSRNTLILDEPFRYLSTGLLPRAGKMLQRITRELGLQVIMVTHSEQLKESADKVFKVTQIKNISHVSVEETLNKGENNGNN